MRKFVRLAVAVSSLGLGLPVAAQQAAHPPAEDALGALDRPVDDGAGAYRTEAGDVVTVLSFGHGDGAVRFLTDWTLGLRGPLVEGEDGGLRLRTEPESPFQRRVDVSFEGAGDARTLVVRVDGAPVRRATRVPLALEEVRFASEDRELAGTVVRPLAGSDAPGVVFVHGSGPATRHDYMEWSWFFAARGVAALMYDKQGAGESTGDWEEARFDDLAADAAAAVRFLRARPGVDAARVGLSGGSQGGWVAPLAAARLDTPPAFLIVTGGGPVTPREQERYRRMELVRARVDDPAVLARAERALDCYLEFVGSLGERCGEDLRAFVAAHAEEPWFRDDVGGPRRDPLTNPWPAGRTRFARELDFDPRPSYRALAIPVMAVLGTAEQTFPVELAIRRFESLVARDRLAIHQVDGADHGLFLEATEGSTRHQSPAAMEAMTRWIAEVTAR